MKKKFLKLMEKEGFILFLFVCVCIIAGGTLFLSIRNLDVAEKPEETSLEEVEERIDEEVADDQLEIEDVYLGEEEDLDQIEEDEEESEGEVEKEVDVDKEENKEKEEEKEGAKLDQEEEKEEELEFIEEEDADDVEPVNQAELDTGFIMPIDGPILTEFTKDTLVYSETLDAWVGHRGVDIEAEEGTPVLASMDGVVEEVYEDQLWGIVIVVDHGNSIKTKYANLSTKEMVKVGGRVKKGDHISKVGNTAKIEMLMKPHLHYEVIKNEEIVDPSSISR